MPTLQTATSSKGVEQGPGSQRKSSHTVTTHPAADPWIERYLELTGRANPDRIGLGFRLRACPDCGTTTLAGLDSDVAALPVYLHSGSLTATGEAVALLLGLRTFALVRRLNGLNADQRDSAAIRQRPPTVIDVATEHRCGWQLPAHLFKPRPRPIPVRVDPPF